MTIGHLPPGPNQWHPFSQDMIPFNYYWSLLDATSLSRNQTMDTNDLRDAGLYRTWFSCIRDDLPFYTLLHTNLED